MLSLRLRTLANFLDPCDSVCDIGSDHAYLPIYLLKHERVHSALIVEIKEKPLQKAIEMTKKERVDHLCHFFLSDGLNKVHLSASSYVLAGMGSETILEILKQDLDPFKMASQIVIQSNSKWSLLRKEMQALGFKLIDELFIHDRSKDYLFLKYHFEGFKPLSEIEIDIGPHLMSLKNEAYIQYLNKKIDELEKVSLYMDEDKKTWLKSAKRYLDSI